MVRRQSPLELVIFLRLKNAGIYFEEEYRFCERLWRFDFCLVPEKIAIEAEGGIWINGGHTRGSGFLKDMKKYNRAVVEGFRVLRYNKNNIEQMIPDLRKLLCTKKPSP